MTSVSHVASSTFKTSLPTDAPPSRSAQIFKTSPRIVYHASLGCQRRRRISCRQEHTLACFTTRTLRRRSPSPSIRHPEPPVIGSGRPPRRLLLPQTLGDRFVQPGRHSRADIRLTLHRVL